MEEMVEEMVEVMVEEEIDPESPKMICTKRLKY